MRPGSSDLREHPPANGMPIHKVPDMLGHRLAVDVASRFNFARDACRQIARPVLERVEGGNTQGIAKFSGQEIGDNGFQVAAFHLT